MDFTCSAFETSTANPRPATPSASTSCTTGGIESGGREPTPMLAPAFANAEAQALPMPPLPPVIMAVRPSKEKRERSILSTAVSSLTHGNDFHVSGIPKTWKCRRNHIPLSTTKALRQKAPSQSGKELRPRFCVSRYRLASHRADDSCRKSVGVRCWDPAGLCQCACGKGPGCRVDLGAGTGTKRWFWFLGALLIAPIPEQFEKFFGIGRERALVVIHNV